MSGMCEPTRNCSALQQVIPHPHIVHARSLSHLVIRDVCPPQDLVKSLDTVLLHATDHDLLTSQLFRCMLLHCAVTDLAALVTSSSNLELCSRSALLHSMHCLFAGSTTEVESCIWSVLVLPDGTMVSGDSAGAVQLWDSQHGTLLQAFHQHKADVLSVAASGDGNTVFATGIDTQVHTFVMHMLTYPGNST